MGWDRSRKELSRVERRCANNRFNWTAATHNCIIYIYTTIRTTVKMIKWRLDDVREQLKANQNCE